jgi:hypothetical protein
MGETVVEVGEVRGLLRVDAGGIVLKCLAVLVTSNSAGLRLRSVLESVPNRVAPEKNSATLPDLLYKLPGEAKQLQ